MVKSVCFNSPEYFVKVAVGEDSSDSSPEGYEGSENDDLQNYENSTVDSTISALLDQVTLTNSLLVGIILFIGIFFGAFCMGHLFSRIRKD